MWNDFYLNQLRDWVKDGRYLSSNSRDMDEGLRLVNNWWHSYQKGEAEDRFLDACRDGRMVIRQSPVQQIIGTEAKPLNMRLSSAPLTIKDEKGTVGTGVPYHGYTQNAGLDGIRLRMKPESFNKQEAFEKLYGDTRGKYALGLHDLSASLLNPGVEKLSDQIRWKTPTGEKFKNWVLLFMPVAREVDVQMLNVLNALAKAFRVSGVYKEFCDSVFLCRKRMTRIKYAQETDMGAGFVNKQPSVDVLPKFRYGAGDVQGTYNSMGVLSQKVVEGASAQRALKAQDYKKMLSLQLSQKSTSNEVILCIRAHEGTRFPLYTKNNKETGNFDCLGNEESSAYITGGFVPNEWEKTMEK